MTIEYTSDKVVKDLKNKEEEMDDDTKLMNRGGFEFDFERVTLL